MSILWEAGGKNPASFSKLKKLWYSVYPTLYFLYANVVGAISA